MKTARIILGFMAFAPGLMATSAVYDFILANKEHDYMQTDVSTAGDTSNPWSFKASVEGSNLSGITTPTVTPPPSGPSINLVYDSMDDGWRYEQAYNTMGALDSAYADGTYTITAGGQTFSLPVTGDAYPNAPIASVSTGVWSGGVLLLQPGASLTVTTNSFTGYNANLNGRIGIEIDGNGSFDSIEQFYSATPGSDTLSLTNSTVNFVEGSTYSVMLSFNAIVGQDPNSALGSTNVGIYSAVTSFNIEVVPEPAAEGGVLGLVALAGCVLFRRRVGLRSC